MKTSLQLKISQSLSMTPQLQQAIRLLQLSTVELQQEIQEALDSNPLLEEESNEETLDSKDEGESAASESESLEILDTSDALEQKEMPDELPVDTTWDDVYSANTGNTGISNDEEMPIYQGETTESLQDYLLWQLDLTPFSDTDRAVAVAIIEGINEQGFLTQSSDEILESVGIEGLELDEVEAVLKHVQQFDPLGVGSRNLQECLLLQLKTYPADTPFIEETRMILSEHIDLLSNRDYRQLSKVTKLKEAALRSVMQLIHELDPRPGNKIVSNETTYIIPDVTVFKHAGEWHVTMAPDTIPRLKINQQYAALAKSGANSSDTQFIRSNLQEAKWLIKSLESRNETLLKVARCIVERQKDFFDKGEEAMKPMVLNDIAEEVDMHESTISRVTTQKYMDTPKGIFQLKYFFSSHVKTDNGGECSSTAIRAVIKKLIAAENPAKPLSDSKIATLLDEQQIKVARRTIAKYRESLGIPPSNQRKSLL